MIKLIITQEDFESKISNFIETGKSIQSKNHFQISHNEYIDLKKEGDYWMSQVKDFLKKSFDNENNIFLQGFLASKPVSYIIQNIESDNSQNIRKYFEEINLKIRTLEYHIKLIKIADAIVNPEEEYILQRKKYSIQQKLDLILEKLYELGGDGYHFIDLILELNGIELSHRGEDREFANVLENQGYIDTIKGREISVKINMNGKMYVEDKKSIKEEHYDKISSDFNEISKRIDDVINYLTKLGFGQEIIFEELEELRELYTQLNKKNWGQLLKGKLMDLSLSKMVENDTISYIYNKITGNDLLLP